MRFEMTTEGYKEAKKYLEYLNKRFLRNYELSADGFTLVALANSVYEEHLANNTKKYNYKEIE